MFRAGHSTDHALLELIDQIRKCYNEKNIFQEFLLPYQSFRYRRLRENNTKIRTIWICGKNLLCFKSYLSNRKQYIEYRDDFHW